MTCATITLTNGSNLNVRLFKFKRTLVREPVAVDEGSVPDAAATQFRSWWCSCSEVSSAKGAILSITTAADYVVSWGHEYCCEVWGC